MQAPRERNLRTVAAPPEEEGTPAPDARAGAGRGGRWLSFLALLLLLAALAGLGVQTRRIAEFQDRIGSLEGALSAARAELRAREALMDEVRTSVAGLRGQVEALEALVAPEPPAAAPGPAPAPRP